MKSGRNLLLPFISLVLLIAFAAPALAATGFSAQGNLRALSCVVEDEDYYDDEGSEATGVKATGSVNVRTGPGLDYDDMGALEAGDVVTYLNEYAYDGRGVLWYKVGYYAYGTGWVSSAYSVLTGSQDSEPEEYAYDYVKATGGDANVRSGPSLDSKELDTMHSGEAGVYLDSCYDDRGVLWYHVEFEGIDGWVSSRYTTAY